MSFLTTFEIEMAYTYDSEPIHYYLGTVWSHTGACAPVAWADQSN